MQLGHNMNRKNNKNKNKIKNKKVIPKVGQPVNEYINNQQMLRPVTVIQDYEQYVRRFKEVKYVMDDLFFNYCKILFNKDSSTELYTIPDLRTTDTSTRNKLTIADSFKIKLNNRGSATLFLNFDYLMTSGFSNLFTKNPSKYAIGIAFSDKVQDIMAQGVDNKNAAQYRNIATQVTSRKEGVYYQVSFVNLMSIPKVLFPSDKEQGLHLTQFESTDIRNLDILDQVGTITPYHRTSQGSLEAMYIPHLGTIDNIGMLNGRVPTIIGGYDVNNQPEFVKQIDKNLGNAIQTKEDFEKTYDRPLTIILQAYQLFKDIIMNRNYSRMKLPYMMIQVNGAPGDEVEFNYLAKYELIEIRKIGHGNAQRAATHKDVPVANKIRKIRRIFYNKKIKDIIELLGDRSGIETSEIPKKDRNYLKTLIAGKQQVFDQIMATLIRLNH